MKKSTKNSKIDKPSKPYPDFPLTPHNSGRWCKSIRGKVIYFSAWGRRKNGQMVQCPNAGEWRQALLQFEEERDALFSGREPQRTSDDDLTIADLCNAFLTNKQHLVDTGEITFRTFSDYKKITDLIVVFFGSHRMVSNLAAQDFGKLRQKLSKTMGPVSLGNKIQGVRTVFKYAKDDGLIKEAVTFGQSFKKPSKKVIRKDKKGNGQRMFEADEIRSILDAADPVMKAMVLLGANCGFGQSDISSLPKSAVDLEKGWIDYPRPKTAIDRRVPLWPETASALREAIERRPEPKNESDSDLVFLTKYGSRWVKISGGKKQSWVDAVGLQFGKLLRSLDLKRLGLNFYALRHVFETIGGESKDQVAVNAIMGHVDDSMAGVYRERISDERLKTVTDTVRSWLWPDQTL